MTIRELRTLKYALRSITPARRTSGWRYRRKKMLIMPSVFFRFVASTGSSRHLAPFHSLPGYPKALIRLLKFFGWSIVAVFCGLLLGLSGAFLYLSPGLPSVEARRSILFQIDRKRVG